MIASQHVASLPSPESGNPAVRQVYSEARGRPLKEAEQPVSPVRAMAVPTIETPSPYLRERCTAVALRPLLQHWLLLVVTWNLLFWQDERRSAHRQQSNGR